MKVREIVTRAEHLLARLPVPGANEATLGRYKKTFMTMLDEPGRLDCLRKGDARDTYQFRRAALYATSRTMLVDMIDTVYAAGRAAVLDSESEDLRIADVQVAARRLFKFLNRIEPAIQLDPPSRSGITSSSKTKSRWNSLNGHIKRAHNSKKNQLRHFGKDWPLRLWAETPENFRYRNIIAIHLLTPVRPEELVPGARPNGWSSGVIVTQTADGHLCLSWQPAKTHAGKYGSPRVEITLDPTKAGDPAQYLVSMCASCGGCLVVSVRSKNAVRKAIGRLGRKVFPQVNQTMTPYLFRHQFIADLKATCGAGEAVAAAAGHCVDDTQTHYGRRERGNQRHGIVRIYSARRPKSGNIARVRMLAAGKRKVSKSQIALEQACTPQKALAAIDNISNDHVPAFQMRP
ncbi:MAG: hypothetical protein EKK42_09520 [Pseudonocardiaceae bacterium]|nr:MAG: hypothetical protein EKK42_09520 [Pseudonocardiaceae bacterium]